MRHPVQPRHLEQRQAFRRRHFRPVDIGYDDGLAAQALAAPEVGDKGKAKEAPEDRDAAVLPGGHRREGRTFGPVHLREEGRCAVGIGEFRRDAPPFRHEARQRQRRHQHGQRRQHRLGAPPPGEVTQPDMQSDRPMGPDDQQKRRLAPARRRVPDQPDQVGVIVIDAEQFMRAAREDDVGDQEQRDRQPQAQLHRLARGHAQRAAPSDPPEGQRHMGQERAIENHRPQGGPRQHLPRGLERLHRRGRHEAQRDVQEVKQRIGEKDQPRDDARLRLPGPAPQRMRPHGPSPPARAPVPAYSAASATDAPCSASQRSASSAAMQPIPALVTAWRYL